MVSPEQLIAFTERVAQAFEAKQIPSPVHLNSASQAEHLIRIFQDVKPEDWVFSTWRSAWHCLLKGWPEEELFQEILKGHSMHLTSEKYRVLCSSIVGGHLPIASGVAAGIQRRGGSEQVWCFVGDMAACSGLFSETARYCSAKRLPIRLVIEDNGFSTDTPTWQAWGVCSQIVENVSQYSYERNLPHVGTGKFVRF